MLYHLTPQTRQRREVRGRYHRVEDRRLVLLMLLATPVALGSLWALVFAVALCGVVAARLLDEERDLSRNLAGYKEYCGKVRYRLIPFVW